MLWFAPTTHEILYSKVVCKYSRGIKLDNKWMLSIWYMWIFIPCMHAYIYVYMCSTVFILYIVRAISRRRHQMVVRQSATVLSGRCARKCAYQIHTDTHMYVWCIYIIIFRFFASIIQYTVRYNVHSLLLSHFGVSEYNQSYIIIIIIIFIVLVDLICNSMSNLAFLSVRPMSLYSGP